MEAKKLETRRHVGIDLGKRTYVMAVVDEKDKVTFSNGKTSAEGRKFLCGKIRSSDMVAIEAGNLAFALAKELEAAAGCEVVVLNPGKLAIIWASTNKTDKEDALKLAHHIQEVRKERLPLVPVPSEQELLRRKLIAHRAQIVKMRTQMVNVLHGLFLSAGITTVKRSDLATKVRRDESIRQLCDLERDQAEFAVKAIDAYEQRIGELDGRMAAEAKGDMSIQRLQTVPGVGPVLSLAFTAFAGDARRFANGSQLSNYLGLCPRVDISCTITRGGGRITKRGNSYLRGLLIQAAWAMIRSKKGGALKERFAYMTITKSLGKKRSIVAVARRLAELMHTILKNESEYEIRKFKAPLPPAERLAEAAIA